MGHEKNKEPELVITRIFDAPREMVFEAWTQPKWIALWWGPAGFTSPFCEVDFRVGGTFRFCMRGPDGKDYWNKGFYKEIVAPEKIISTMHFSDKDGNIVEPSFYGMHGFTSEMLDIVTFDVHEGNKTKLTLHRNHSISLANKFGEVQGWNQSLDRFEEALKSVKRSR